MSVEALIERRVLRRDVPLGPFTTYKSGGAAGFFAEVADRDQLAQLIESGLPGQMPVLVLGRGSNLVVADSGFDGLVIRLGRGFSDIRFEGLEVEAGGVVPLPRLARSSVDHEISGLEFFVGIPGSVGGAVRQNAGCFGEETRDRLVSARVVALSDGGERDAGPQDLSMSYRHSNLGANELVVSARLRGEAGDQMKSRERLREITRWRRDNQPGGTLNAGSVFKNPPDISAGELIDSLGLKGMTIGGVRVSEKHANFFVATPDATSDDIRRLVVAVKDRVLTETGTNLETEIQFVGFEE